MSAFLQWFIPFGQALPLIAKGFLITLEVTVIGLFFGFILGSLAGLGRISRNKIIYGIATVYVELVRGTPILIQIFFFFFGLSDIAHINLTVQISSYIALAINSGAYIAEIVRGAVDSIDKGQMEAGRSLGLTHSQAMRYIIWPQAIKRMIPNLGNQFIISLKDSSLLSVIALTDIVYEGKQYMATTYNYSQTYILIGIAYLIITIPLSLFLRRLERRLDV